MKPYYFTTNKDNIKLLQELNSAIEKKKESDPLYEDKLRKKYKDYSFNRAIVFTEAEKKFLASHKSVTVAYDSEFVPIEGLENGEPSGYTFEVLNKITQASGLKFNFVTNGAYIDSVEQFLEGKVDILSSVNTSIEAMFDRRMSEMYIDSSIVVVGRKDFNYNSESEVIVAMSPRTTRLEGIIKRNYPNSVFKYFNSQKEAYRNVLKGNTDLLVRSIYSAQLDILNEKNNLKIVSDTGEMTQYRFAFSKDSPPELISIFNKVITSLTKADENAMMIAATIQHVEDSSVLKILFLVILAFALSGLTIWLLYRLRKSNLKIRKVAYFDRLTGLPNIEKFKLELANMLKNNPGQKFACIVFDVSNFKLINDRFGSTIGDKLLCTMADEGKSIIDLEPSNKSIIARLHSDTFVYVVPLCTQDVAVDRIYKLINAWRCGADYIEGSILSFHFGRYLSQENDSAETILRRAYTAHAHAKKLQENQLIDYDDKFINYLHLRSDVLNSFDKALLNGEFHIYLQPQYASSNGQISGAEVLVRWIKDDTIKYYPDVFIPILEESGKISELDSYLREKACIFMRSCIDEGLDIPSISINVSRIELLQNSFCKSLEDLLIRYELKPSMLHVEITETAYISDFEQLLNVIEELQSIGILVEMDDFGSGYSSLNTLKDIPVDVVKLDMKFLKVSKNSAKSGAMLSSVVRMAHDLNIWVIAEGVETSLQAEYLKSIGCEYMQGYYFAKPMPSNEFKKLLSKKGGTQHTIECSNINNFVNFLDASTQETLLFNTFLGGAAIVEHENNKINLVRINDKFFDEVGLDRDDMSIFTKNIFDCFEPNSLESFKQRLVAMELDHKEDSSEWLMEFKKGEPKWFATSARWLSQKGSRHIFYLVIKDITEKKTLEISLNDAIIKSQQLIENMPGGISVFECLDDGFKILFLSEGLARLNGQTKEEAISDIEKGDLRIHPSDLKTTMQKIFHTIKTGEPLHVSYRCLHKNGDYYWCNLKGSIIGKSNKNPVLYALFQNIDEGGASYLEALNHTGNIMSVICKDDYELLFINEAAKKFAFTKTSLVVGCKCYEYIYGTDKPCQYCKIGSHNQVDCALFSHNNKEHEVSFYDIQWNGKRASLTTIVDKTKFID